LGRHSDRSAGKPEQRVAVTLDREVGHRPRHVAEVPRERADVGEHCGGRPDLGVLDAQSPLLELLDPEVELEVVVGRWLEPEQLVELLCTRTRLLGEEDTAGAQHSADLGRDEGLVAVHDEVERRGAEGEPTAGL